MTQKTRRPAGNSIIRILFVGVSILFQVGWLLLMALKLNEHYAWISAVTEFVTLLVVLKLYTSHTNTAMKLPLMMLLLAFPVMGLSLLLLTMLLGDLGSTGKRLRSTHAQTVPLLPQNREPQAQLLSGGLPAAEQSRYLQRFGGWPVYGNTAVEFHSEGAQAFESLKAELEKAEHFIFMEYFIVSDGSAFRELMELLTRKSRAGVDVRLMYDDIGSVGYVNLLFARHLTDAGVQCRVFNPAMPVVNLFMNHRDHRKITVIDGRVGFTGGYNLSDEYFGRRFPYGKWKDTGLRLEGEAVCSLTAAFLEMWNANSREPEDPTPWLKLRHSVPGAGGFVQPYTDDPLGPERVAETVYLGLIHAARTSLYITTPYLIITDEMTNALAQAAKRGVDVRIVTPGIPDKKTVYALTRSFYGGLAGQGVRIYEYTPGFIHSKQILCDGIVASVGTSNLDYRSLYLHFENNVLLYGCDAVRDIAADFEALFPQCREVTEQYRTGRGAILLLWQCFLRLFAPLM